MRTLFTSADWKPDRGGIAELYASLLERFPRGSVDVLTVRAPGGWQDRFAHPVHRMPITFRQSSRLQGLVRWVWHARRLARAREVDVVQAGTLRPAAAVGAWLRRLEGRPCVVYVHGRDVLKERGKVRRSAAYRVLTRDVLRNVSAVIANSRFTAVEAGLLGVAAGVPQLAERVHVVLPGADPERFRPGAQGVADVRRRLGLEGRRVALIVTRLVPRKGVHRALEAVAEVARVHPDLTLLVAGEGPERPRLEARAARPDLAGRVVFAGDVSDADLPALYRSAEVFLLPGRREGHEVEGFGIVLLEAGASALPVVAGRTGGVEDAVVDGETGRLVDPESQRDLVVALGALLADPERARAMGRRAREAVVNRLESHRAARCPAVNVVLLSSYEAWHGGEVVLASLAAGLADRGHAVTLVCRPTGELARRAAGGRGVRVLGARLRGEGDPRTHAGVLAALRSARADVLLTNLSRDLKFGAPAARLLGVPHVHRYAEVPRRPPSAVGAARAAARPKRKRAQRWLLRRAVAGVVTPSRFVRDLLVSRVPGGRPVGVIPNAVDARAFRPDAAAGRRWREAQGVGRSEPLVGCVGQLDLSRKAPDVLLAAAGVARARPVVALVGDGPDAGPLRERAAALGVRALFTGFEADTAPAFNAFDVVALPSRQESFGLAVAEAMACGRAVIAAAAGSVPELLRDGREGWLVPPDDVPALAAALDEALAAPETRARRGAAARERVERELSPERMLSDYEAAFEAALERRFEGWAAGAAGLREGPP